MDQVDPRKTGFHIKDKDRLPDRLYLGIEIGCVIGNMVLPIFTLNSARGGVDKERGTTGLRGAIFALLITLY